MLKNGKAPGDGYIIAELLKRGGKDLMAKIKLSIDIVWK